MSMFAIEFSSNNTCRVMWGTPNCVRHNVHCPEVAIACIFKTENRTSDKIGSTKKDFNE